MTNQELSGQSTTANAKCLEEVDKQLMKNFGNELIKIISDKSTITVKMGDKLILTLVKHICDELTNTNQNIFITRQQSHNRKF